MPPKRRRAIYMTLALVIFAGLSAAALYVHFRAARIVSGALSGTLGQPVTVGFVDFMPASGLTLHHIEIKNPPGYETPILLSIGSLTARPDYGELSRGKLVIAAVSVNRPELFLERNDAGVWNFQSVIERLKKRKPRKYTLHTLRVKSGVVRVPQKNAEILVQDASLMGLSTLNPAPVGFELTVREGKSLTLTGSGTADLTKKPAALKANFALDGGRLERYVPVSRALDLTRSSLTAEVDIGYSDGLLEGRLAGRLAGVKTGYYRGRQGLEARFAAEAVYARGEDLVKVGRAALVIPGITRFEASGSVGRPGKDAAVLLKVKPGPVELSLLDPYLPEGAGISGRLKPDAVSVRGTLRPFRLYAEGGMALEGVGISLKGVSVKDINGKASLSVAPDKAPLAGLDIRVEYVLKGAGIYSANNKFTAGSPALDGKAERTGGAFTASGRLGVVDAVIAGREFESLLTNYSYAGNRLSLAGLFLKEKGFSITAERLDAELGKGAVRVALKGGSADLKDISLKDISAWAEAGLAKGGNIKAEGAFSVGVGEVYGLPASGLSGRWGYAAGGKTALEAGGNLGGADLRLEAGADVSEGRGLKNPYLSGNLVGIKPGALNALSGKYKLPVSAAGGTVDVFVSAKGPDTGALSGSARVRLDGLGLDRGGKPFLRGLAAELRPEYGGNAIRLPESLIGFGESFSLAVSGSAKKNEKGWTASASFRLPETDLLKVQEGVIEALPATLKWADAAGSAGADGRLEFKPGDAARLTGEVRLADARLDLPDKGISVGPANGKVPLGFSFGMAAPRRRINPFRQESFEREGYAALLEKYSKRPKTAGLVVEKASYGFVVMDDIALDLRPGDGYYEIAWLGLSGFGGRGYGYGVMDFSGKGTEYAVSLLVSDFSLRELCDRVPGIKGYLTGRVDGLARVMVGGKGFKGVAGAGMFWAEDGPDEEREISKEFLKKLMGKALKKYMFIGDRYFDTGEMDIIFSGGEIVFDRLLISNTNLLGKQDLKVTVAPVSNKVSLEHLLEVVREVKERAGQGPGATD